MNEEYTYYAIRHKETGELMPQGKKDRGYSHWNPSNKEHEFIGALSTPRLLDTRRRAAKCIASWAAFPNGDIHTMTDWETGASEDVGVRYERDGRKKEDLEVVEITLIVKG